MAVPTPSKLDHQQCIQGSYDESTGRLRVDAQLSSTIIAPPGLEVSIDSIDDSILVVGTEDGTKTGTQHVLKVGSDLNLRVKDDTSNTSLASIDGKIPSGLTVTSNRLLIDGSGVIQPVSGTVTANQGTSPWIISGTVAATQSGTWTTGRTWTLNSSTDSINVGNFPADSDSLAQGSTTSGQLGSLIMGATTTNAPSYSTTTTNPLSLDTSGLLRISLKDTPSNTNKLLVTVDPITFSSPQHVILDSGTLTSITNTVTVSGTVITNQGTSPWITTDSADGPVTPGTVASKSILIGGQFNTSLPVLTNTQQASIQLDSSGRLIISPLTNLSIVKSQLQDNSGNALNSTSNALNTFITNSSLTVVQSTAANLNATVVGTGTFAVQAAQSGSWTVQQGTPPWSVVGNIASGSTDSGNPVKVGGVFNTALPTVTNGQRVDHQSDANGRQIVTSVPLDGSKTTYSASLLNLTTAALATDFFVITGSATKIIRIIKIGISGISGSVNNFSYQLIKRSSANTGGTTVATTAVPHDSSDSAATAVIVGYTVNPTSLGTSVGNVRTFRYTTTGNNTLNDRLILDFGDGPKKAIVLRGTSQQLCLNLNATTINNSSFDLYAEWTEE